MGQHAIQKNIKTYDLCNFNHTELLQKLLKQRTLNFDKIQYQCLSIGQGCAAKVYLYKKSNCVLKIMKGNVNNEMLIKQISFMEKLNSIWPGMFEGLVLNHQQVVGFSMKYFQGCKIHQAYKNPMNIYNQNNGARVRLVKKLKQLVKKLQQLMIGHGDLHVDNILIKQPNIQKQDCQLMIIDYGLAFVIDDYGIQKPPLTGWAFMKPSQAKSGYYYDTAGLNAYMFGRVALQILLLQNYDDYSHTRDQSPEAQLNFLGRMRFDESVKKQIELYLDKDIKVRNKMLFQESKMIQQMGYPQLQVGSLKSNGNMNDSQNSMKLQIGWSLWNIIKNDNSYDDNYYVRNPQKLGYKN